MFSQSNPLDLKGSRVTGHEIWSLLVQETPWYLIPFWLKHRNIRNTLRFTFWGKTKSLTENCHMATACSYPNPCAESPTLPTSLQCLCWKCSAVKRKSIAHIYATWTLWCILFPAWAESFPTNTSPGRTWPYFVSPLLEQLGCGARRVQPLILVYFSC